MIEKIQSIHIISLKLKTNHWNYRSNLNNCKMWNGMPPIISLLNGMIIIRLRRATKRKWHCYEFNRSKFSINKDIYSITNRTAMRTIGKLESHSFLFQFSQNVKRYRTPDSGCQDNSTYEPINFPGIVEKRESVTRSSISQSAAHFRKT